MKRTRTAEHALGLSLLTLATACSSSTGTGPGLTFTGLNPWDGGADAGCSIGTSGTRIGCATAYRIEGNPVECPGFDSGVTGSADTCKVVCNSGLVCALAGLSDGTNAVDCSANCASPEF
jgi:hypothetical protein